MYKQNKKAMDNCVLVVAFLSCPVLSLPFFLSCLCTCMYTPNVDGAKIHPPPGRSPSVDSRRLIVDAKLRAPRQLLVCPFGGGGGRGGQGSVRSVVSAFTPQSSIIQRHTISNSSNTRTLL